MSNNLKQIIVIGTGEIAGEYCKVLKAMEIVPDVVGRKKDKAKDFGIKYNVNAFGGGIDNYLQNSEKKYDYAIVATDALNLCKSICTLLNNGVNKIFAEKPAGMDRIEIETMCQLAEQNEAEVYVAYNRRFYASTNKALEIIKADGGVKSFNFEFTEWSHVIETLNLPDVVKEKVFLGNSTHVVDLAFFLGGEPNKMACFKEGSLNWHKNGCVYAGAGVAKNNALFSYQANWAAPGRWGVEILTAKHRLYFRPIEKLAIQEIGSVVINEVEIDDKLDRDFKPGFYKEVESFINDIDDGKKKTIQDQLRYMDYFEEIAGQG